MEHEGEDLRTAAEGTPVEARPKAKGFSLKKYWPVIAVPLVAAALVGVYFAGASRSDAELEAARAAEQAAQQAAAEARAEAQVAERPTVGSDGRVGYATEGVVATDPETFQDIVDQMYAKADQPGINLQYKDLMISDDGVNFDCFIGNSEDNAYDMFITIYSDINLSDELYLSELLRPGSRFEKVRFQKKLEPGEHTGYLVYTQVSDEKQPDGKLIQVIRGQIATTIRIVVNE